MDKFEIAFHNRARQSSQYTVFLVNGVKLSGSVQYACGDCIALYKDGITQLVYKHAIATILPSEEFDVYDLLGEGV